MSLPAIDDFAGTGPLSGNWTLYDFLGYGSADIVRDTGVAIENHDFLVGGAWWSADSFSPDQYAKCVVGALDPFSPCGPVVRTDGPTGYRIRCVSGTGAVFVAFNGITDIAVGNCLFTPSDGDLIELRVVGTTLSSYQNGVLTATTTDATYATGAAGIYISRGNSGNPTIDDFEANNVGGVTVTWPGYQSPFGWK